MREGMFSTVQVGIELKEKIKKLKELEEKKTGYKLSMAKVTEKAIDRMLADYEREK